MTEPFIRARPDIDPDGRGRHELVTPMTPWRSGIEGVASSCRLLGALIALDGLSARKLVAFPAPVALVLGVRALGPLMALRFGPASGAAFIPVAGLALAQSPVPGPVGRPVTRVFPRHYLEA